MTARYDSLPYSRLDETLTAHKIFTIVQRLRAIIRQVEVDYETLERNLPPEPRFTEHDNITVFLDLAHEIAADLEEETRARLEALEGRGSSENVPQNSASISRQVGEVMAEAA